MRTIKVQAFLELPDGSKVEARDVKITTKRNDSLEEIEKKERTEE